MLAIPNPSVIDPVARGFGSPANLTSSFILRGSHSRIEMAVPASHPGSVMGSPSEEEKSLEGLA